MARTETDYATQRNRCSQCGHRLDMRNAHGRCTVINGAPHDNKVMRPCGCKEHTQ